MGAAVIVTWIALKRAAPPELNFTKTTRETLVSSLNTNGKVEPIEWMPVRSERMGVITRSFVSRGQLVRKGDPLVELDPRLSNADFPRRKPPFKKRKLRSRY